MNWDALPFDVVSLTPLVVVLPILGAALTFVFQRSPRAQRFVSITTLSLALLIGFVLLLRSYSLGAAAVTMGGWAPPFGITLVVDEFAALMLVVSNVVSLAVLIYATGQGYTDQNGDGPISVFYPTYMFLVAGVSNAFVAGDLFNLYVGFEIFLTASYVLITLGGSAERVRAGTTYVVVSVVSSMLFLISIGVIYAATGTVSMADVSDKIAQLGPTTQTLLHLMVLIAFGVKAAVFPLSFWLPDSYPTAPAPVTAVFAGLLTKVGVYAIVRTETLLFRDNDLSALLMWVAVLTMIVGILGALVQTEIKRMLSFTLTSHIGYMVFGIALGTQTGYAAAIYYVAHHILVQTSLFMVVGLIERRGGTSNIERLGSLAKLAPFLAVLYFIPAMNLAGIPPFSGFIGKVGLVIGGVEDGTAMAWVNIAASLLTSLLTLVAVARVWNRAFWRRAEDAEDADPMLLEAMNKKFRRVRTYEAVAQFPDSRYSDRGDVKVLPGIMVGSTAALVCASLSLTIFAGPLFQLTDKASAAMLEGKEYRVAVYEASNRAEPERGGPTDGERRTLENPSGEANRSSEGGAGK